MIKESIAVIGVGNMGGAIVSGLLDNGVIDPENLVLYDPSSDKVNKFGVRGVKIAVDIGDAVAAADVVLLAVKPQVFPTLLEDLEKVLKKDILVVSIAAGIKMDKIKEILGKKQPVGRVMPNFCALVGGSMSVWVKSD